MSFKHVPLAAVALAGAVALPAAAGDLEPLAEIPSVEGLEGFCAPYGDFIACSTAVLNWITTNKQNPGPFSIKAAQGDLAKDDTIVVYSGGGAAIDNPTVGGAIQMDDSYTDAAGNTETGFSTNKSVSAAETGAGVLPYDDPDTNNSGVNDDDFTGDENDYWDIQLSALLTGLTTLDGLLRDPIFVFDNNQTQNDPPDIKLWGLIALRDVDGNLLDKVFEFRGCDSDGGPGGVSDPLGCSPNPFALNPDGDTTVQDPTLFATDKSLGDDPLLDHYVRVQNNFCVDADFKEVVCGSPDEVVNFDQNLGTSTAEFFGYLPELTGAKLKDYVAQGYDTLSVDLRFFDDTGGFEDLFILAMNPTRKVPEPGTLALLGAAGLGLGLSARRRRARRA